MEYTFFYICINRTISPLAGYGFKFVVNNYTSTTLNYSILFQGNSKSSTSCYFNCGYRCLVIIVNTAYFSYSNGTVYVSGDSSSYTNLSRATFSNDLDSSSTLYTLAGLSGFYFRQGGNALNFYYSQAQNGTITINTTIIDNYVSFNYLTFPSLVKMYS